MSRVGKMPIAVPKGVDVTLDGRARSRVKGPLGTLARPLHRARRRREATAATLMFRRRPTTAPRPTPCRGTHARAGRQHGQRRDQGLREEARRWSASATAPRRRATKLNLSVGFSHPVVHEMPTGIKVETPDADRDRDQGRRPAARRPGRRRGPRATVRPSPTRARASATPTRRSCSKRPRRSKERRHD